MPGPIIIHLKLESLINVFVNELFKAESEKRYVVLTWFLRYFEEVPAIVVRTIIDELTTKDIIRFGIVENPTETYNKKEVKTIYLNKDHSNYEKIKLKNQVLATVNIGSKISEVEVDK